MVERNTNVENRVTRYLGCWTAYGVFWWRYLNAPMNWGYVGSQVSVWVIVLTMLPETVYPFVYIWVHQTQKEKALKSDGASSDEKLISR